MARRSLTVVWFVLLVCCRPAFAADVLSPASQRFAAADVSEAPNFQRHVLPLLGRVGCNGRACHGSFQGQGGFRLSLFGYDFKMDHEALTAGDEPRVDLAAPAKSLMLAKPTGTEDDHGGGHRLDVGSWQYNLLHRWITAGAKPVAADDPTFVKIEVTPREIVAGAIGDVQPLRVVAHWSDGTIEDVTPLCRFQTNDESIAKVDAEGRISLVGKGDTFVVTFYDNGVVPIPVMLPVSNLTGDNYPSVPTPTKVDELVIAKLKKLGIVPSELAGDAEFLRRVSLDLTGTLPTPEEITQFLADSAADKRAKKIDELLERPAYAAWWATKLCDITGNSERSINDNVVRGLASAQWYYWIHDRVASNTPYDEIVEGIVLAVSRSSSDESYTDYAKEMSDLTRGEAEDFAARKSMPYYWARRNTKNANERALAFSYSFLGVRLQCAECHKHPFDQWSQEDFQHFTVFFDRISYGNTNEDKKEIDAMREALGVKKKMNGDQQKLLTEKLKNGATIPFREVFVRPISQNDQKKRDKEKNRVQSDRVITPKVLGGDEIVGSFDDPRQPLMDWLRAKDNPYFARAIVNRVWAHYFNVGIVEPADDLNLANAPSNRELLDWLAREFVAHDYDLKWLHRTIANSRTYQLSWRPNATNELDERNFSHAIPRRLPAEVLYDAVAQATAGDELVAQRAEDPVTRCAIGMGRGYAAKNNGKPQNGSSYALTVFGKPQREATCDCERTNDVTLLQTVYLRNDNEMNSALYRREGWLAGVGTRNGKPNGDGSSDQPPRRTIDPAEIDGLIEQAYLRTLSRVPERQELASAQAYIAGADDPLRGLGELMWALLNTKEFVLNH